jgi:hypothetical protein
MVLALASLSGSALASRLALASVSELESVSGLAWVLASARLSL